MRSSASHSRAAVDAHSLRPQLDGRWTELSERADVLSLLSGTTIISYNGFTRAIARVVKESAELRADFLYAADADLRALERRLDQAAQAERGLFKVSYPGHRQQFLSFQAHRLRHVLSAARSVAGLSCARR